MKKVKTLSDDKLKKIHEDPFWVNAKRYDFNLKNMILRFPDGCPDRIIAHALGLTEEELRTTYDSALKKLQKSMGVTFNEE